MDKVLALALNPAIDVSSDAATVRSTHKVRTHNETYDPGGGGVNVARVITELGGEVELAYLAGGVAGDFLDELLDHQHIRRSRIRIAGNTRISFTVHEENSGLEYRFVANGPTVLPGELDLTLAEIARHDFHYLVASGSLPVGAPDEFLIRVAEAAAAKGARFVLDSSGRGLKTTLKRAPVYLVKPSLDELEDLVGRTLDIGSAGDAAADLVKSGAATIVAVTLGADGAILATANGLRFLPAVKTEVLSAVGAGDSFLGAMLFALTKGWEPERAFAFGMAGGAAALLHKGTKLCHRDDVERLYRAEIQAGALAAPT
jgi:6-phosphofructokinase 2